MKTDEQTYADLCALAGDLQYKIYCHNKELADVNQKIYEHNIKSFTKREAVREEQEKKARDLQEQYKASNPDAKPGVK